MAYGSVVERYCSSGSIYERLIGIADASAGERDVSERHSPITHQQQQKPTHIIRYSSLFLAKTDWLFVLCSYLRSKLAWVLVRAGLSWLGSWADGR